MSELSSRRVVLTSFVVDLLDVFTNLVVALLTGSATVFSEMVQGIADSIGSAFLVIGEQRSGRPRDQDHPLGYSREAFFWGLLSAFVMLVIGAGLSLWRGVDQLLHPEPLTRPLLAVGVLCLAVGTNGYAVLLSARKLRTELGSLRAIFSNYSRPLVKGAFLRDIAGTSTSILGLLALLGYLAFDLTIFDAIGALLSSLLMLASALFLIVQARALITGQTLPQDELDRLRGAVLREPRVEAVNGLVAIYAGAKEILVEMDLDLAEELDTIEIEALLDAIEARVRADMPEVRRVRVLLNSPASPASRPLPLLPQGGRLPGTNKA